MKTNRTKDEIMKDFFKVETALKAGATSFAEIVRLSGLTLSKVKTTLVVTQRTDEVLFLLNENKKKSKKGELSIKKYLFDASIASCDEAERFLNQIVSFDYTIVIPTITNQELTRLKNFPYRDEEAISAERIQSMVEKKFEHVLVCPKEGEEPEDAIVRYCSKNKNKFILLTSDKEVVTNASKYGVETIFFKKTKHKSDVVDGLDTLGDMVWKDGNLQLQEFDSENKCIEVISGGLIYDEGPKRLRKGDDIYIATFENEYISFVHYLLLNEEEKDNVKCMYKASIYDRNDIKNVHKNYQVFLMEAMYRHEQYCVQM